MDLENLARVVEATLSKISQASGLDELDEAESEALGKRSEIALARRGIGGLDPQDRKKVGQAIHGATRSLTEAIADRRAVLEVEAENALLEKDRVDLTLPYSRPARGTHHLLTRTMEEVCDVFRAIGYEVAEGPELELAWYNFDALNTPPTHPSRFESDTMYVEPYDGRPSGGPNELLLRTQTSPMQARFMEKQPPPVYVVVPGRVYRTDTWDATHSPVFHQIEGLAVDSDITFGDLKGTLAYFAQEFFGAGARTRFVPHFFPFTEPSAEMLVWFNDEWLELLGCGMVDPNVFEAVGYDPSEVTGFAFGMGVERLAMVRHGITDIRHFYDSDLRVLRQFR
ncbi:MAG: phenylalanine--tRNA ligase subunit alpha [bacterium]|nr:phenylalanine--tRNA ligase subunit alpha [bacterium]MDE0642804.1 phenylalanine--tRNA ligase subunit alpha [bacterium]